MNFYWVNQFLFFRVVLRNGALPVLVAGGVAAKKRLFEETPPELRKYFCNSGGVTLSLDYGH